MEGNHNTAVKDREGTLVVLERPGGYYSGYRSVGPGYALMFNVKKEQLFESVKVHKAGDCPVHFIPAACAEEFLEARPSLKQVEEKGCQVTIWRRETGNSFRMGGGKGKSIASTVPAYGYKIVRLEMGFTALVVENCPAAGVYELTSGGLVGDTVEQVNEDILSCGDRTMMEEQIRQAAEERGRAVMVGNARFGMERSGQ